jgi:hypothetical protein
LPPADYCIHVLAEADGDEEAETDEAAEADEHDDEADEAVETKSKPTPRRSQPAKPSRGPAPAVQWNSRQIVPNQGGPGKGLWSRSVGGPLDGTGATGGTGATKGDPFDLRPVVPLRKRSTSWQASVRGSLLER